MLYNIFWQSFVKIRLPVLIYCILYLRPCQLALKLADETNYCVHTTLRIARNLQRHRSVSLRQHGFLTVFLFLKLLFLMSGEQNNICLITIQFNDI